MRMMLLTLLLLIVASTPLQPVTGQDIFLPRLPDYLGTICITPKTTCDVPPSPLYSSCYCAADPSGAGQVLG